MYFHYTRPVFYLWYFWSSIVDIARDCAEFYVKPKWAATCDFPQCGVLISVDSDKPVQPPIKRRNSRWCSVSSLTVIEYSSD